MKMKFVLSLMVVAAQIAAAGVVAGEGEVQVVSVAEAATLTESGPVMLSPTSDGIQKTGGGEYVLPLSAFAMRDTAGIAVREGTLTIADSGASGASVAAPQCLRDAALWLDAAQNTVVEDGVVTKWLDVREGATDNNAYFCAQSNAMESNPSVVTSGGMPWMDFGGAGSGKHFTLAKTDRTAFSLTTVVHAYAVLDTTSAYGHVFGVQNGTDPTFYPGNLSGAAAGNYWSAAECDTALYSGRTYVDGVWIDGVNTPVKTGAQLLEWESGNQPAKIRYFFRDRNVSGRQGGAKLGEVVLFTNRLDSAQRMEVEEYLMQKWLGKGLPKSYEVKTAVGTVAAFDNLPEEEFAKVSVTGLGTAEKTGAGTVAWRDAGRIPGVPWRIAEGAMAFESGDIPLAFASGDALAATTDDFGVTTFARASGTAGTVSALGGGAARVSLLPADTTTFAFSGAALSLVAPATAAPGAVLPGGDVLATIECPGFEGWGSTKYYGSAATAKGWTFAPETGSSFEIFVNGSSSFSTYGLKRNAPEGSNVLGIKVGKNRQGVGGAVSTTVIFPVAGRYEFTCKSYTRPRFDGLPVDVSLVKDGATNRFARIHSCELDGYHLERFTTPEVDAGECVLLLTYRNPFATEKWCIIDDLKMRFAPDIPSETVFTVPNGGFEFSDITEFTAMNTANTAQGWTLAAPASGEPDAALAWRAMTANGRFNAGSAAGGNIQLALFNDAGSATSDAFTLPAGKWRLRLRAGRLASYQTWNGQRVTSVPALAASATTNGVEISLGAIFPVTNNVFRSFVMPTVVESDGTLAVSLCIRQTVAATKPAALLVDDLEFVRMDNLVENGDFETADGTNADEGTNGGWTLAFNRGNGSNVAKSELVNPVSQVWGLTTCDGAYALHIVDCGAASRSIAFPAAGFYRIAFRARGRASYSSGEDTPDMRYAGNRVKALLDGEEIYRSPAIVTTNFVYYSGLFRVAAAGTKTFTLQGCAASGDKNAFVDLLSIEKASVADVPSIPEAAEIEVALDDNHKLRLDYPGRITLKGLRVNGKNLWNEISEATYPDYIAGPGSAYVEPLATMLLLR